MRTTRPQSPQFNYSYVELGYDESDFDVGPFDVDGDGLTLSGSFEINDEWHAFASYGSSDLGIDIDIDTWTLGAGYVFPLQKTIDLYGRVLYIDLNADAGPGPGSADEDGLGLQFRIRARVTDEFELVRRCRPAHVTTSPKRSRPASESRSPAIRTASASTHATRSDLSAAHASRRARLRLGER